MNVLIVGYGKMGKLVEQLATEAGMTIAGRVDEDGSGWAPADVAIDFSTADALTANFPRYVESRMPVVIGTTGWGGARPALQAAAAEAHLGVVASANFSIGVNLFEMIVRDAARLLQPHQQYGAWVHEIHHAAKRDAPSGTAILLRDAMIDAGYRQAIDMASSRAGAIPGTHTVGFDSQSDTIELIHRARDRRGFASGALLAARWIQRREGWVLDGRRAVLTCEV